MTLNEQIEAARARATRYDTTRRFCGFCHVVYTGTRAAHIATAQHLEAAEAVRRANGDTLSRRSRQGENRMTITARFASRCPDCGQPIRVGDLIEWRKGSRARHASCVRPRTSDAENGPQLPQCEDCGAVGVHTGHMECPEPGRVSDRTARRRPSRRAPGRVRDDDDQAVGAYETDGPDRLTWSDLQRQESADERCTCHDEAFDGECAYHQGQQYRQGLAEGARYSAERRIYGDALAEQFALQDELNRYNRGED